MMAGITSASLRGWYLLGGGLTGMGLHLARQTPDRFPVAEAQPSTDHIKVSSMCGGNSQRDRVTHKLYHEYQLVMLTTDSTVDMSLGNLYLHIK